MIKIILTIVTSLFILNLLNKNLNNNEDLVIFLSDYQIEISYNFTLFIVIIAILILTLLLYIVISCYFTLKYKKLKQNNSKFSKAIKLITAYMTNQSLGDYKNSHKKLKQINKLLPDEPLNHLLNLQDKHSQKPKKILENLEKLKKHTDTKHFALQGLAIIEKNKGNYQKAEQYLEDSLLENPNAQNTVKSIIDLYFSMQNWQKLHKILTKTTKNKVLNIDDYNFEQAICYLNLAELSENSKIKVKYIKLAQKIAPENPKIQICYARSLLDQGKKATLTKYIKNLWSDSPLPELIEVYSENIKAKKNSQKFKLIETLILLNPRSETAIIKYINLALYENYNLKKAKLLITEYLNQINSENLYDLAINFFESTSDISTDNELYHRLLKEGNNYHNYPAYICNFCAAEQKEWQVSCSNCNNVNSFKYSYTKPLALIKINDIK